MFGYIKPSQPELKVKEAAAYKALYCGLCRTLGKNYGIFARLSLSYDLTFFAMLYAAVGNAPPPVSERRLPCKIFRKVPVCQGGAALDLAADLSILTFYYKLLDSIADSSFFPSIAFRTAKIFFTRKYKKIARRLPQYDLLLAQQLEKQKAVENNAESSLDAACEPSAAMLSGVLSLISDNTSQKRVLERLGYQLGRFIYLCDALDDLPKDINARRYNPIAHKFSLYSSSDRLASAINEAADSIRLTCAECERALALLDMSLFSPIIENIIVFGLPDVLQKILSKRSGVYE